MKNFGNLDLSSEVVNNGGGALVTETGPQRAKIVRVADNFEKCYLTLWFDLADQRFSKDANGNFENWNRQGKIFVWYNEKAREQKTFDAFITAITNSNQGFVWDWNEQKLVGKMMVVVYGEEEWKDNEGTIRTSIQPRMIRSTLALNNREIKPLPIKKYKEKNTTGEPQFKADKNGNFHIDIPQSSKEMNNSYPTPADIDDVVLPWE